jgi:membrane protease YdiL (CAAX protease family)
MLSILGLMASVSIAEELLFRGVLFRIVENLLGTWGALEISGALFGVIHLLNPHATLWGAISIALEAGLMLGAAYAATRTLWAHIGLHFGWNFIQVGVFGGTASGSDHTYTGLFQSISNGPIILTGGAFGPKPASASHRCRRPVPCASG